MATKVYTADELTAFLAKLDIKIADLRNFRGPITVEPHSQLGGRVQFPPVAIGAFSFTQSGRFNNVTIGRYCSIAPDVVIGAPEHPTDWVSTSPFQWNPGHLDVSRQGEPRPRSFNGCAPITIGHDVWIGQNAILTGGINIANGAVIAAGAVVTKDVPPYAIVGGVPAKTIRHRFSEELVERLLESKWWEYLASDLAKLECSNVNVFLEQFERNRDGMTAYRPEALRISKASKGFEVSNVESAVLTSA